MTAIRDTACRDELARLTPNLRRFARALVQDHNTESADDIVQATLIAALEADHDKRGVRLLVWLMSTLVGLHRSRCRQVSADKSVGLRSNGAQSGSGRSFDWDLPRSVRRGDHPLLGGMPLECREVLLLVALEKFSYAQVAEALGVSLNTVFGRLSRAREHLGGSQQVAAGDGKQGFQAQGAKPRRPAPYLRVIK